MGSSSLVQQTPGDPHEPTGGEPTIMAFQRPANRPGSGGSTKSHSANSLAAADSLPVVLRLPELTQGQSAPPPAAPVGATRPWIGIAMWCATGALAIVAAVLIFTGKPESSLPTDEAPQWQPGASDAADSNHSAGLGDAGGASAGQLVDRNDPAVAAAGPQAVDGSPSARTGTFPWRDRGPTGQPADTAAVPNGAAPFGTPPTGGLQPSFSPGDNGPAGGLGQPTLDPSGPAGLGDPGAPDGLPPDQSKFQSSLRTAAQPNTAGGARFDGRIRNLKASPRVEATQ